MVHTPFVRMVKFQFFEQLPVPSFQYPVVSSLILFLSQFSGFAYYMIGRFVYHHITYTSYFLHLIYFCLKPSLSLWRCFMLLSEEIQFLSHRFPFLSHIRVLCEISLVSRLKHPYNCFSSHFCFLYLFQIKMGIVQFKMGIVQFKMEKLL